ncbi:uncharacterized protein [Epargyreus clarus]|uniref:uncharacterized protein n=1 Tax=Epargyreus clarus TaxID=520877 RepID=UPI003C2F9AA0
MSIDSERLILEIKNRPALWNTDTTEYTNRKLKAQCWEELVDIFNEDELTTEQRILVVDAIQKKWKCIRGCYTRELNRQRLLKCGADVGHRKRPYVYLEQLKFLKKYVTIREEDPLADPGVEVSVVKEQKKMKKEEDDVPIALPSAKKKPIKKKEKQKSQDEDELFLLSLVNTLKRVPPQKKMATKIKIMSLLEKATQSDS